MKQPIKDILIFAAITIAIVLFLTFTVGVSTIDLQFHDTYFVLDSISLAILTIGPLTLIVFLVLAIIRKFRAITTNIGLIVGLILVSIIIFRVGRIQTAFRDQVQNDAKLWALPRDPSDRDRFLVHMDKNIFITWCIFGVGITGIALVVFRTYKVLNSKTAHEV